MYICEATTQASRLSDHKAISVLNKYCQWACGWYQLFETDRDKVHLDPRDLVVAAVPGYDNLRVFWRHSGTILSIHNNRSMTLDASPLDICP